MRRVDSFAHAVREQEHVWIPLADGTRLSAKLWLPAGAGRVPAVLEYIPYRKRDMTALRDAATHRYLAGHGYACVRLDARGTGESEGLYGNQFSSRYAEDGLEVIDWLARQDWCDGQVAMFGLSWGGAISLQVAARRPAALKAIVCAAGVDDRYALRYPGGCLTTATLAAITAQIVYATKPPDPALVGEAWRAMWRQRLDAVTPVGESWIAHAGRDAFWQEESLATDYARIACPMLLAAGWADPAFAAAMLRVLEQARAPRRAILGPWGHRYPHLGRPGPTIGWLQETLRWLDRWLKGRHTGAESEPALRAWMPMDSVIDARPVERAGRWIGVARWQPQVAPRATLHLGAGLLAAQPLPGARLRVPYEPGVGGCGGEAMPIFTTGPNPELAGDQRPDDALSLRFDGEPLASRLELLGEAELVLTLAAPVADGLLAARLCELRPDGASRRVTYGFARVTGETATLRLFPVADGFAPGSRIRLALSRAYWPILWPLAAAAPLEIDTARSSLILPLPPSGTADIAAPPPAEAAPGLPYVETRPAAYTLAMPPGAAGDALFTIRDDIGEGRLEAIGLTITDVTTRCFRRHPDRPGEAELSTTTSWSLGRGDWRVAGEVRGTARSAGGAIELAHELVARENDVVVCARSWQSRVVPRR